eukprot:gene16512-19606_t
MMARKQKKAAQTSSSGIDPMCRPLEWRSASLHHDQGDLWRWLHKPPPDFVFALDAYLKSRRVRLKQVFSELDEEGKGSLHYGELKSLILCVLPDCQPQEIRYIQGCLDTNGDGYVTHEELMCALEECITLNIRLQTQASIRNLQHLPWIAKYFQ